MFKVTNLRNSEVNNFTSDAFKNFLIDKSESVYEDGNVLGERTGIRVSAIQAFLNELSSEFIIQEDAYLVTTVNRINSDKDSRYIMLVDNDADFDRELLTVLNENLPVYNVEIENTEYTKNTASPLSVWFRSTMGRAFSFVDIDYILLHKSLNYIVFIEEKYQKSLNNGRVLGYGQKLSYKEILEDIAIVPSVLNLIRSDDNLTADSTISYIEYNKNNILQEKQAIKCSVRELSNRYISFKNLDMFKK